MIEVRFNYDYFGTCHSFKFNNIQQAVERWSNELTKHTNLSDIKTPEDLKLALQKCVNSVPVDVRIEVLNG